MRAALYCRLSDEDRNKTKVTDESESIKNQKSLLTEYCLNHGWEIADIYCDESMSGADSKRPEFNRMIEDCEAGRIDIVLCKTQSRFSRDIEIVEHFIHNKFREWGVRFIGILDHADTEDHANKKSRQINGLVNEWYLEDLSFNIKKTLRHKKENGIYTGAFAPYGYKLSEENRGKLFIDHEAAETVKEIYALYLSGMGYVKIAKTLNSKMIPCPSEYKRLRGSKFKTHSNRLTSKMWTESAVREILKNRVYKGDLVQGKTSKISYKNKKRLKIPEEKQIITPNAHEPIIDSYDWERVNEKIGLSGRAEKTSQKRHIFSGRIFCMECNSIMWKMSYKLKDGRYEYLKCKATKCSDTICTNRSSARFDEVRNAVEREIKKIIKLYFDPNDINYKKFYNMSDKKENDERKFLKDKILKQNLNIKQLYKDKLDGIIESEMFCDIYTDIKENIKLLNKRLSEIEKNEEAKDKVDIAEYINNFCENIVIDEFTVSEFVESIMIGGEKDGRREIKIFWNI